MNKKRTSTDFSKHILEYKEDKYSKIWDFKRPNTNEYRITFINSHGIMAVTGDVGNWIFCREFHPSAEGSVSDYYWCEKLQISSKQSFDSFDSKQAEKELNQAIEDLKSENYEDNELTEIRDYYNHCKDFVECGEHEYMSEALNEIPAWLDHESIIEGRKMYVWLEIVFDGFEEICRRLKNEK